MRNTIYFDDHINVQTVQELIKEIEAQEEVHRHEVISAAGGNRTINILLEYKERQVKDLDNQLKRTKNLYRDLKEYRAL